MTFFARFSTASRAAVAALIVFVLAFDVAFALQKLSGAYQSEFGGHPHEAAHYLSALFWRDFASSQLHRQPQEKLGSLAAAKSEFASEYEASYPQLNSGAGKSLFDGLQALWMLAFPVTRGALLMLEAVLAGILAAQLFAALRTNYGSARAGFSSALLLLLPLVRQSTALAMPDLLSAILVFGAGMAFGDFLDGARKWNALAAGALGALAILSGAQALQLFAVFPMALVFARKTRLLRSPWLWAALLILIGGAWLRREAPHFVIGKESIGWPIQQLTAALGIPLTGLSLIGAIVKILPARKAPEADLTEKQEAAGEGGVPFREAMGAGKWAAAGALIVTGLLWLTVAPHPEPRYVLPLLPPVLMFALAGGFWLMERFMAPSPKDHRRPVWRIAVGALFATLVAATAVLPWTRHETTGFAPLVDALLEESSYGEVTLVSSDSSGEQRFLAELAMRELQRPGRAVVCGTSSLGHAERKDPRGEPAFKDDASLLAYLISQKVHYLVYDEDVPEDEMREHHYQLRRVIETHLDRFWEVAKCSITRDGVKQPIPVKLYKIHKPQ